MGRIAYVNGRYLPHGEAVVHVEDRGFQFADGVYEYFAVFGGRLADADGHLERLWRSLSEIRIRPPMSEAALIIVMRETVRRNRIGDGSVYLQITRGDRAPRSRLSPPIDAAQRRRHGQEPRLRRRPGQGGQGRRGADPGRPALGAL